MPSKEIKTRTLQYALVLAAGVPLLSYILWQEVPSARALALAVLFYGLLSFYGGLRVADARLKPDEAGRDANQD